MGSFAPVATSFAKAGTGRRLKRKGGFFFEKKNQKTFATLARMGRQVRDQAAKVFCFFASEKQAFLGGRRERAAAQREFRSVHASMSMSLDGALTTWKCPHQWSG
jgi:hypothetical protein